MHATYSPDFAPTDYHLFLGNQVANDIVGEELTSKSVVKIYEGNKQLKSIFHVNLTTI